MTGQDVLAMESVIRFLAYFCVEANPLNNPDGFMSALRQLDPRYKDDRNLVRYQLESDQTTWPAGAVEAIMACARDMRMLITETSLVGDFVNGLVIILGGARQSNLDRARYAAKHTDRACLVIAGSDRRLGEDELTNVANYARGASSEIELCLSAAEIVGEEYGRECEVIRVDNERAGTPDVLRSAFSKRDWPTTLGDRPFVVAAVTTQIYQLSTELDLRRVAKSLGLNPDNTMAAGTPSDPEIITKRTTATYLSEVLRTLRAAVLAAQAGV